MNRTQIYLRKSQQFELKKIAQKRGTTISALIRDAIEEKLNMTQAPRNKTTYVSLLETVRKIEKLGEKGPPDLATNMDKYLYGNKK